MNSGGTSVGHAFTSLLALLTLLVAASVWANAQSSTNVPDSRSSAFGNSQPLGTGKVVAMDYFYNHEMENGEQTGHIWENTGSEGYSQFGDMWETQGATIAALRKAPTLQELDRFSVYIIVSPNNEPVTSSHHIDSVVVDSISSWVREGGILVIFGNSKGKCDFDRLNDLSRKFGILFNGDLSSTMPTPGDSTVEYYGKQMATKPEIVTLTGFPVVHDGLPDHEIFRNMQTINIVEFSTLTLSDINYTLLQETHDQTFRHPIFPSTDPNQHDTDVVIVGVGRVDTVMAISHLGNGTVFAIGCPWLDNASLDLPQSTPTNSNRTAAANFVRWALTIGPKSQRGN